MGAIVVNDLRQWIRQPQAVLVSLLVPLVVLVIAALAGTVGAGYTVAVVDDQPADVLAALERSPYLRTVVMDRDAASEAVATGEVAGTFDTQDDALVLSVAPYGNDDLRRNLVMRQQAVLADINTGRRADADLPHIAWAERGLLPETVSDQAYLAAGALVFTAIFSGLANTAFGTAREWEKNTAQYLLVSPHRPISVLGAKLVTGTVQSLLAVAVALGVIVVGFGVHPVGTSWLLAGVLLATIVGSGALGLVLGVALRRIVPALLISVVASLVAWFVGGGFAPVTLQPSTLHAVSVVLPSTYAISAGQRLINGLGTMELDLLATTGLAVISVVLALMAASQVVKTRPTGARHEVHVGQRSARRCEVTCRGAVVAGRALAVACTRVVDFHSHGTRPAHRLSQRWPAITSGLSDRGRSHQ